MVPFLAQNYRVITFDPHGNGWSDSLRDLRIWYMTGAIDYSAPGRLTDIGEVSVAVLEAIPADPAGICRLVPGLVLHPFEATDLGLDAGRLGGQEIRQASGSSVPCWRWTPRRWTSRASPGGGWSAPAGPSSY